MFQGAEFRRFHVEINGVVVAVANVINFISQFTLAPEIVLNDSGAVRLEQFVNLGGQDRDIVLAFSAGDDVEEFVVLDHTAFINT